MGEAGGVGWDGVRCGKRCGLRSRAGNGSLAKASANGRGRLQGAQRVRTEVPDVVRHHISTRVWQGQPLFITKSQDGGPRHLSYKFQKYKLHSLAPQIADRIEGAELLEEALRAGRINSDGELISESEGEEESGSEGEWEEGGEGEWRGVGLPLGRQGCYS